MRSCSYFLFFLLVAFKINAQLFVSVNNINASCFGSCDGAASINVSGGTSPYSFTWSPGNFSGSTVSNLCAGIYTVQVRDALLATTTLSVTILQPAAMVVTHSVYPQTCVSLGSASLSVTGGGGTYFYSWSPNIGNGPVVTNITAGSYTCTVIGMNGCSLAETFTVPLSSSPPVITITGPSTTCSQYTQTFTASGATNYTWSGGQTGSVFTSSYSAFNNYMSTVTLNVTGYNAVSQCSATATKIFTVWQSPIIFVSSNAFCETASGHSIVAVGAQTYSVTGNSWWVTPTVTTSYSITGTSAQGCVSFTPAISTLTVYPQFTLNVNQPTICSGQTPTWIVTGAPNYTVTGYPNNSYVILATDGFCWGQVTRYVYPYPDATVTAASGSICAGSNFTVNPSGAYTYSITGNSFSVSPAVTSTYAVTGTNSWGCTDVNPALVTVTVVPHPTLSVNSGTICSGNSYVINPAGAPNFFLSGGNYTVTPNVTTSYTLTGHNSGCASVNTVVCTVSVDPRPLVSISSGSVCKGESFNLIPQGAFSYSITGGQYTVSPSTNTLYYVIGSSSLNCPSLNAATATITVFNPPQISVLGATAVCIGAPVTWSAVGASTYSWSNNLNSNPIVFTPIFNTNYSVIGVDIHGCRDTAYNTVIVNNLPTVSAVVSNPSVCSGQTTSIAGNGASTYTISGGAINALPFAPPLSASYTITGVDLNGCENSVTVSLVVYALPTVTILATNNNICKGETVVLTAQGANTYQWSGGSSASQYIVSPQQTASYSVTGRDVNGCNAVTSVNITVNECTGLAESGAIKPLVVFPNPNKGAVTIIVAEASGMSVYSREGKLLYQIELAPGSNEVRLESLNKGLYFLRIENASRTINHKMVVE